MKYTIEQIDAGEDEVIVRYRNLTQEIERLLELLKTPQKRLIGTKNGTQVVIDAGQILYIESVDGKTFVCTQEDVLQVDYTLAHLEQLLHAVNFFRCSKSMILNIDRVTALKSLACNRIDATLCSGEHIIISRTYASEFRKRLKGGAADE
ncbi:MAG: LytTR family transcriptional regulator DNA-binding domain-containing protein [Clostridia bacterium]|nr:LytTR family transcriptional regulator DNA-binding domain-containing protein [Clostridia bacterium]